MKTIAEPTFRDRITNDDTLTGHHLCAWAKRLGISPSEFAALTGLSGHALQPLFLARRPADWVGAGLLARDHCPRGTDPVLATGCIAHACRIGTNRHGEPVGPPEAIVKIAVVTTLKHLPPDEAWAAGEAAGEAIPSRTAAKLVRKAGWPTRNTEEEPTTDGALPKKVMRVPRNMLEFLEDLLGVSRGVYGRAAV